MQKTERIHSLDSIRGISSVVVVIFHCLISFQVFYNAFMSQSFTNGFVWAMTNTPLHAVWAGPEAVFVFFVLSGFVLSLPFLRGDNERPAYGRFIVKRICRIYIPYIVIMLLYMALITLLGDYRNIDALSATFNNRWDHPITSKAVVSAVLMLDYDIGNVNGVVWSLIHEMRISLIFPILIFFIKKTDWKLFLPLGLGISILGNILVARYAKVYLTGNVQMVIQSLANTLYYIPFFIMGAGLAKYRETVTLRLRDARAYIKIALFIISLALITIKWVLYPLQVYGLTHSLPRAATIGEDWISGAGIVPLFAVVLSSKKAEWLLTRKVFLWLGKVSYSLYLVHVAVIMVCARYLGGILPLPFAILLAPLLALPIAGAAYRLIEGPAMKLGRRLTAKSQK